MNETSAKDPAICFVIKLNFLQGKLKEEPEEFTLDGSVDSHGSPAIRAKSGRWVAGIIILCKLLIHINCRTFFLSVFYYLLIYF